jgi:hypothetical protein
MFLSVILLCASVSLWLTSSLLILHHPKIFAPFKNFQFECYGWKTEKKNSRPENPDSDPFHCDRFIATNVIKPCRQLSRFHEITFVIRGSSAVNDIPVHFRMDGSPILLMTELPTFSKSARYNGIFKSH